MARHCAAAGLLVVLHALALVQGRPLVQHASCRHCDAGGGLAAPAPTPTTPLLYLHREWLEDPLVFRKRQTWGTDTTYTTSTTTVYVNGSPAQTAPGATVTETVTVAPEITTTSTTLLQPPNIVTTTVYVSDGGGEAGGMTYTTRTTVTQTPSRTTSTSYVNGGGISPTRAPAAANTQVPIDGPCYPGDASRKEPGTLNPTHNQNITLYVLGIYILGILVAWNLLGLKTVLYPMKMLTVAYHEFWHIVVGVCLGQKLHEVSLDPTTGGRTVFNAEEPIAAPTQPVAAYFVAMVGNALVGSLLVFCGFNTLASKIASFFIGFSFCAIMWYASGAVTLLLTVAWIGLMIGLWFIEHALYLKYYVLFLGVMTALYFAWDIMDDLVFRKVNPCCPKQLEYRFMTPAGPAQRAVIFSAAWMGISVVLFIGFILLAIYVFRETPHAEYCQAQTFLPT